MNRIFGLPPPPYYFSLKRILALTLVGSGILWVLPSALAQDQPRPIQVDVSLVLVNVSLFDAQQRPIEEFRKEDIELFEDRVAQQIIYFGRDDLPLNLALVLDVSGSVVPVLPQIKLAANEALSALKPDDAVALFSFSRRVRRVVDYTTNHEIVVDAIAELRAGGGTALIDGLYYGAHSLQNRNRERRRVIVMISDNEGMPVNERSEREAIKEAQEAGAVVHGIQVKSNWFRKLQLAIPTSILTKKLLKALRQSGDMNKFAAETGGSVLSAEKSGGIGNAFRELMRRLGAQHYVGYVSTNTRRDGSLRKIEVRLTKEGRKRLGKVKIQHRRAYIAPPPPASSQKPPALPKSRAGGS